MAVAIALLDLPKIAGGFDTAGLASGDHRPTIDTDAGLAAAEFLLQLLGQFLDLGTGPVGGKGMFAADTDGGHGDFRLADGSVYR